MGCMSSYRLVTRAVSSVVYTYLQAILLYIQSLEYYKFFCVQTPHQKTALKVKFFTAHNVINLHHVIYIYHINLYIYVGQATGFYYYFIVYATVAGTAVAVYRRTDFYAYTYTHTHTHKCILYYDNIHVQVYNENVEKRQTFASTGSKKKHTYI